MLVNDMLSPDDTVEAVSSSNWLLAVLKLKHNMESLCLPVNDDRKACGVAILFSCITAPLALVRGKKKPSVEAIWSMVTDETKSWVVGFVRSGVNGVEFVVNAPR